MDQIVNIIQSILPNDTADWIIHIIALIVTLILITLLYQITRSIIRNLFINHMPNWLRTNPRMSPKRAQTISNMIRNGLNYILIFIYVYWMLTLVGIPIGTLLAGAGIAGIAIGLGAQQLIKDIINSFFIIFEGQFEVGDWIELPEKKIAGEVASIGIRSTAIIGTTGEIYYIPNSVISIVTNTSKKVRTVTIDLPCLNNVNIEKLEAVVIKTTKQIQSNYASILLGEPNILGFIKTPEQGFNYRIRFSVKNGEHIIAESTFYREYLHACANNNIPIPYSIYDPNA